MRTLSLITILLLSNIAYSGGVDSLLKVAKYQEDRFMFEAAAETYSEAIAMEPSNAALFVKRASVYYLLADYESAKIDCSTAISLDNKMAKPYEIRGMIQLIQGDQAAALKSFDKSLSLDDTNAPLYFNRGELRHKMGDKTGACEDWKKSGELGLRGVDAIVKQHCN